MARKLVFEGPKSAEMFENVFSFYHLLARPASRDDHKANNKILEALEDISEVECEPVMEKGAEVLKAKAIRGFAPTDAAAPRARVLMLGRQYCVLENYEFEALTKALASIPSLPCQSREIEAMWAFLDGAEQGNSKALVEAENGK